MENMLILGKVPKNTTTIKAKTQVLTARKGLVTCFQSLIWEMKVTVRVPATDGPAPVVSDVEDANNEPI